MLFIVLFAFFRTFLFEGLLIGSSTYLSYISNNSFYGFLTNSDLRYLSHQTFKVPPDSFFDILRILWNSDGSVSDCFKDDHGRFRVLQNVSLFSKLIIDSRVAIDIGAFATFTHYAIY